MGEWARWRESQNGASQEESDKRWGQAGDGVGGGLISSGLAGFGRILGFTLSWEPSEGIQ